MGKLVFGRLMGFAAVLVLTCTPRGLLAPGPLGYFLYGQKVPKEPLRGRLSGDDVLARSARTSSPIRLTPKDPGMAFSMSRRCDALARRVFTSPVIDAGLSEVLYDRLVVS